METERESFKADIESTFLRVIMYLLVLNVPFLGLYKSLGAGTLESEHYPFLAAAFVCLVASIHFSRRFFGIRFGWNDEVVFKQGIFRYTEIEWREITKIYETGTGQEWTEGDMLFIRKKSAGKRLFVIQSPEKKIVLEFYRPMAVFRKKVAERLNLKVGNEFNAVWDYMVNG